MTDVELQLNAWTDNKGASVFAVQGEQESRTLHVTLIDRDGESEPYSSAPKEPRYIDLTGYTARLYVVKSDSTKVYFPGEITDAENGKVDFTLTGQCVAAPGKAECTIVLTKEDVELKVVGIVLDVRENDLEGSIESSDEWVELDVMLTKAQEAIDVCETATDAANSAASSATSKITEMDQLKGEIQTAEAARVKAEEGRVSAESTRVSQESARQSAEQQRQTDSAAAVSAANTAAGSANTAADNANAKASLADTAAQNAEAKAGLADTAASAANIAATSATQAAQSAQTQAGAAESAASQAQTQAQAAQSAASAANTAAASANAAADRANKAAEAIEGTDVGDLAVRVDTLEGEMDTVNDKIDGLNVPEIQQSITQLKGEMDTAQQDITDLESKVDTAQGDITQLQTDVSGKVDKETGKGLSSNDYTAADKAKVDAAPSYAEYQLTLASGLTGELHGYRIGNLCRIVGVVTGIKTTATDICSDLPDDLILKSGGVPAVLNPSISITNSSGYILSVYKRALNGDRVLQGRIGKGFASTDPVVNLPCYIDISYPASL